MARMTMMLKVVWEHPKVVWQGRPEAGDGGEAGPVAAARLLALDDFRKGRHGGRLQCTEHSAHGVADTKDDYVDVDLEEQGKAQLVTKRDLSARDDFSKGGMGLKMGEVEEQGACGGPSTKARTGQPGAEDSDKGSKRLQVVKSRSRAFMTVPIPRTRT